MVAFLLPSMNFSSTTWPSGLRPRDVQGLFGDDAVPTAASAAYSRNVTALLLHLIRDGSLAIDLSDEIQAGVVITHQGRVVHPTVASLLEGGAR